MSNSPSDRERLVSSQNTIFSADSQRCDFLDPSKTSPNLVAIVLSLVDQGHIIGFTAVNSDHHDDSALGHSSHRDGNAFDCWPLNTPKWGDWVTQDTHEFRQFLVDAAHAYAEYQIGLAGAADDQGDRIAAGQTVFSDDGGDHIHIGVK